MHNTHDPFQTLYTEYSYITVYMYVDMNPNNTAATVYTFLFSECVRSHIIQWAHEMNRRLKDGYDFEVCQQ